MNDYKNDYKEENTISLLDIFNVVSKHKIFFWINFSIIFIIGVVFIVTKSPQYTYTQIIELPSYYDNKEKMLVWPYELVVEKIRKFYLPAAEFEYNSNHKDKMMRSTGDAMVAKDVGGYLSLSLKGPMEVGDAYKKILSIVLKKLHDESAVILNERANYLKSILTNLQKQKNDIGKVLSIKKVDNFITYEYIRSGMQVEQRINDINYRLELLQQAKASELMRSNLPVGPSKKFLLVLSIFVSLLFSFFAVFIVEFAAKNKNKTRA